MKKNLLASLSLLPFMVSPVLISCTKKEEVKSVITNLNQKSFNIFSLASDINILDIYDSTNNSEFEKNNKVFKDILKDRSFTFEKPDFLDEAEYKNQRINFLNYAFNLNLKNDVSEDELKNNLLNHNKLIAKKNNVVILNNYEEYKKFTNQFWDASNSKNVELNNIKNKFDLKYTKDYFNNYSVIFLLNIKNIVTEFNVNNKAIVKFEVNNVSRKKKELNLNINLYAFLLEHNSNVETTFNNYSIEIKKSDLLNNKIENLKIKLNIANYDWMSKLKK